MVLIGVLNFVNAVLEGVSIALSGSFGREEGHSELADLAEFDDKQYVESGELSIDLKLHIFAVSFECGFRKVFFKV